MLFLHPDRYQWHNEDPMYDGVRMLQRFRPDHVDEVGFANLRCTWSIGCPNELRNLATDAASQSDIEAAFLPAFEELFPEMPSPVEVGVPCGAQFAVSRAQVLLRPREDYLRYRDWLWNTKLDDAISGRIFEYSWHSEFGLLHAYVALSLLGVLTRQ